VRLKEESSQMMFEFGKKNKGGPINPMTKSYAAKTPFQFESSGESR